MTTAVVIQARTNSKRLPNKVLSNLGGIPLLAFLIKRIQLSTLVDEIFIATTDNPSDNKIIEIAISSGVNYLRGSETDVLERFAQVLDLTSAQNIVRITGDCPFTDPSLLDAIIARFNLLETDYLSNCMPPSYPDGLDIEIFTRDALALANRSCSSAHDREHVTPWIRSEPNLKVSSFVHDLDLSALRWTVDEPADLVVVNNVVSHFSGRIDFTWTEILDLYTKKPDLFAANSSIPRNQGSTLSEGQKLWRRAKRIIPGGNMLLSKRSEMFLPDIWPAYFSRAKGCRVWDLNNRELIDMTIMGIGTNLLGYGHPEVDAAVARAIEAGNMSTLNCPEDVWLAEKLVQLHSWADMVRFARTGGEANAVAIRIARAATGRDVVAICGYHGWHDWYLASNLQNESGLEEHLLPGLEPNGVPGNLAGTVQPFSFNRLDQLENIVQRYSLAAVKMEVQRSSPPTPGFLEGVRNLCSKHGIVLIFDECTSGFRETFGGLHLKYGVEPDMAMFGKALGNGYAITAIIGRRSVMEAAQNTFISSTFWTERIGPAAALKSLEVMEHERSWDKITAIGLELRRSWDELANRYHLKISHNGLPALAGFSFDSPDNLAYKTLITQEMLKKGFLASTSTYISLCHTPEVLASYIEALDPVFSLVAQCEDGLPIATLLEGPVCHSGFNRLT